MVGGCLWCSSLIYVFSVGNSIELLGFKYHRQSKKKKTPKWSTNQPTNQTSLQPYLHLSSLKHSTPFSNNRRTPSPASPEAAQILSVHREIFFIPLPAIPAFPVTIWSTIIFYDTGSKSPCFSPGPITNFYCLYLVFAPSLSLLLLLLLLLLSHFSRVRLCATP